MRLGTIVKAKRDGRTFVGVVVRSDPTCPAYFIPGFNSGTEYTSGAGSRVVEVLGRVRVDSRNARPGYAIVPAKTQGRLLRTYGLQKVS